PLTIPVASTGPGDGEVRRDAVANAADLVVPPDRGFEAPGDVFVEVLLRLREGGLGGDVQAGPCRRDARAEPLKDVHLQRYPRVKQEQVEADVLRRVREPAQGEVRWSAPTDTGDGHAVEYGAVTASVRRAFEVAPGTAALATRPAPGSTQL